VTSLVVSRELPDEIASALAASAVPYFPSLTINGQAIDLAHLEPLSLAFAVERLAGRTLTIDVKFTNHCYTETFDPGRHDPAHVVMDRGRKRVFDPQRHDLSRHLPEIIRSLPARSVHITRPGRNYVYVAQVDVQGSAYPLFFHLRRGAQRHDLTMVVESAYPVADRQEILRGTSKVSFAVLCAKTFRGERVTSYTPR